MRPAGQPFADGARQRQPASFSTADYLRPTHRRAGSAGLPWGAARPEEFFFFRPFLFFVGEGAGRLRGGVQGAVAWAAPGPLHPVPRLGPRCHDGAP